MKGDSVVWFSFCVYWDGCSVSNIYYTGMICCTDQILDIRATLNSSGKSHLLWCLILFDTVDLFDSTLWYIYIYIFLRAWCLTFCDVSELDVWATQRMSWGRLVHLPLWKVPWMFHMNSLHWWQKSPATSLLAFVCWGHVAIIHLFVQLFRSFSIFQLLLVAVPAAYVVLETLHFI